MKYLNLSFLGITVALILWLVTAKAGINVTELSNHSSLQGNALFVSGNSEKCTSMDDLGNMKKRIVMENGTLHLELDCSSGNFLKLDNRFSDIPLIEGLNPTDVPPWILVLQKDLNEPFIRCQTFQNFQATLQGQTLNLVWKVREGLLIRSTLLLAEGADQLQLTCEVVNKTDSIVAGIEYPIITSIKTLGRNVKNTYLIHPVSGGFLFRAPYHTFLGTNWLRHSTYPNGFSGCGMQFFSYYVQEEGGFYFACHDPGDVAKQFNFFRDSKGLVASILHWSWNLEKGNDLELNYPIIIASLKDGNWYTAAERYRNWATGEGQGHPDWCSRGRLEDRVNKGDASKWLVEQVGFCTFGISSSQDVSRWIDALHQIADIPVFHVLGYDWAAWANLKTGDLPKYRDIQTLLNQPTGYRVGSTLVKAFGGLSPSDIGNTVLLRGALSRTGIQVNSLADSVVQDLFEFYLYHRLEYGTDGKPAEWFPARFHPENLKAIQGNGDYFAPFLFDFFSFGHDLDQYGLLSPELRKAKPNPFLDQWMHPGSQYWQDFHAGRDARVVKENGADAIYYDISASNIGIYSDRNDLGCPAGMGHCLTEAYRNVYRESEKATHRVSDDFVPRGTEVMIENYLGIIDFAQWRSGGEVQGDMEGEQFLDLQKSRQATHIPLWAYVYHEYGPVMMDGDCKLSREFGDYFYYIASRMCLEGSLLELNYEFSSLERFPGMQGNSLQITYNRTVTIDEEPFEADLDKCAFLREVALARTQIAKKYLAYGRMTRPFQLTPETIDVTLDWYHYNDIHGRHEAGVQTVPSVIHTVWSYRDSSLGALFVNLCNELQHVVVEFDFESYKILSNFPTMTLIDMNSNKKELGKVQKVLNKVILDLEPRRIYLLEFQ